MNNTRSTTWTYRVELSPQDKIIVRHLIEGELRYYNALVNGLAGPIRTMPDALKDLTGRWEDLFGLVAAQQINPFALAKSKIPEVFKPYLDLIEKGDAKKSLLFDIAASPATMPYVTRTAMAKEMLRHAREQSAAYANTYDQGGQVYKFAVETLSPLESGQKRHMQIPRSLVSVDPKENDEVVLKMGFIRSPITITTPKSSWNMMILREDGDGMHTVELSKAPVAYQLKRTDASGFKRKGGGKGRRKGGDHGGLYSMPV